jgi:hypothetical protein
MYWHRQHDDHVFSGGRFVMLANNEAHAQEIVDKHNAEIDLIAGEIRRLKPAYQSGSALDAGRRQLLDHFEEFMKRERTGQQDLQTAFDCLTSWLLDNTEDVFEEEPAIDEARSAIAEKIEELG